MSTEDETNASYIAGNKEALGRGSWAVESAVFNVTHSSTPPPPSAGAQHVRTGDKTAVDGGRAFENVVVNGSPE